MAALCKTCQNNCGFCDAGYDDLYPRARECDGYWSEEDNTVDPYDFDED